MTTLVALFCAFTTLQPDNAASIAGRTAVPATWADQKKAAAPEPPLPAPVEAAFKKAYPDAKIEKFEKKKNNIRGKAVYELDSDDRGVARHVVYLADGELVRIEEDVKESDVPPAVMSAVAAKYPKAKATKERRFIEGTVTVFRVTLKGANVDSVDVSPAGKIVSTKK